MSKYRIKTGIYSRVTAEGRTVYRKGDVLDMNLTEAKQYGLDSLEKVGDKPVLPARVRRTKPVVKKEEDKNQTTNNIEEENEEAEEDDYDIIKIGGGWYLLPNGEKVQGRDEAKEALQKWIKEQKNV